MSVRVEIPTILRTFTGGERSIQATGGNLAELLADLDVRYPGFRERLLTGGGELRKYVNVYINDEDIRSQEALDSRLADGDVVSIIPAVAGGA